MRGDSGQTAAGESMRQDAAVGGPRRWLPVVAGIATGLALCALAYFALTFINRPAPDPTPTARAICSDLTTQRYDSLYTLLSPDLQAQGSEAQFSASQRELDRLLGSARSCAVSGASASGDAAGATLTLQRTKAAVAHISLTQVSGNWRIESYDQTV